MLAGEGEAYQVRNPRPVLYSSCCEQPAKRLLLYQQPLLDGTLAHLEVRDGIARLARLGVEEAKRPV